MPHKSRISPYPKKPSVRHLFFSPVCGIQRSHLIKPQALRFPLAVKKRSASLLRNASSILSPLSVLSNSNTFPRIPPPCRWGKPARCVSHPRPFRNDVAAACNPHFPAKPYVPLIMTDVQSPVPHRMPHPGASPPPTDVSSPIQYRTEPFQIIRIIRSKYGRNQTFCPLKSKQNIQWSGINSRPAV